MHRFEGMGFGMVWWWIIGIIIVAVIIWVIARSSRQKTHINNPPNQKSALDILKERYAKGDIDKKEFEQRKNDLM